MAIRLSLRAVAFGCAWAAAGTAAAGDWQADQGAGRLQFTAMQAGANFTGGFGRFAVRLRFDPAAPESGRLDVTVATPSVDTADADRDEILRSRDFFWAERYPDASFQATHFERDGTGWRADGTLTLRGVTRPAAVHFEWKPDGATAVMSGGAELRRLDFGVGQGEWTSTEWVGDAVGVSFELRLRPATPAP